MTHLIPAEFLGTPIFILDHNGQKWLTAKQVGLALGFDESNARNGIIRLHERHGDEFTDRDTCVVNLTSQGANGTSQQRATRIFSESGCNKLGFFAQTARAKEFRTWAARMLAVPPIDQETLVKLVASAVTPIRREVSRALEALSWERQRRAHLARKYIESLERNQKGSLPVTEERLHVIRACARAGLSQSEAVRQTRVSRASVKRIYRGEWPNDATARVFAPDLQEGGAK
jgi:uncharacterized sporulation protein YeaH/YhbH (DUF444 family)